MFLSILTANNQLTLLYDLLDEQRTYSTVSINEYRQIKKIVRTITSNELITNKGLQFILPEIYNYSIQSEYVQSLKEHVEANRKNIERWLFTIKQTKSKTD